MAHVLKSARSSVSFLASPNWSGPGTIDPDTCIDCGACVPECPFEAIFPEEDVPSDYELKAGQEYIPFATKVRVTAAGGEVIDLTSLTELNYDFFSSGPGYDALNM